MSGRPRRGRIASLLATLDASYSVALRQLGDRAGVKQDTFAISGGSIF